MDTGTSMSLLWLQSEIRFEALRIERSLQNGRGRNQKMIHYELIFLYMAGLRPRDVIRKFGYSRGSAYRFYRIYREARKRAQDTILADISVSPSREKNAANLDHQKLKIRCSVGDT